MVGIKLIQSFQLFRYPLRDTWSIENMTLSTKPEVHNITTRSEKDQATVTVNMHKKFGEVSLCGFGDKRTDVQADRQTDRHTYTLSQYCETLVEDEVYITMYLLDVTLTAQSRVSECQDGTATRWLVVYAFSCCCCCCRWINFISCRIRWTTFYITVQQLIDNKPYNS